MECVPCKGGVPTLTTKEIAKLKPPVPKWSVVTRQRIKRLERVFKFKDFAEALAFTNKVGAIAEEEGHHPDIYLAWGKVRVTIWTHKVDGLTRSDFVLAAKIERLV